MDAGAYLQGHRRKFFYGWRLHLDPGRNSHIDGPCSRFFIRRLKSGRLLMINHYNFDQRIDLDDIMNQGNVKAGKAAAT